MSAQGAFAADPQLEIRSRIGRVGLAAHSAGAATILGQPVNRRLFRRRLASPLAWLHEGRPPDEREYRLTPTQLAHPAAQP